MKSRIPNKSYFDNDQNSIFEIIVYVCYNSAFDEYRDVYVLKEDSNLVELIDGRILPLKKLNLMDLMPWVLF